MTVQSAQDHSTLAVELSEMDRSALMLRSIDLSTAWEAVSSHLNALETRNPGLYPRDINIDIMSAYKRGQEVHNHIRDALRKKKAERDYANLAHAFVEFEKRTRMYDAEVKKVEHRMLTMSPVDLPCDNSDSSEEPHVSQQVIDNTSSMPVSAPQKGSPAMAVKPKVSLLAKIRDEQSPSADPEWVEQRAEKKAKRQHAH